MQEWLLQIWVDFEKTVVFVTHDVEEAVYLSDQVFVMTGRPGRIKAVIDVPLERPRPRSIVDAAAFLKIKQTCLGLLADERGTDDAAVMGEPTAMTEGH